MSSAECMADVDYWTCSYLCGLFSQVLHAPLIRIFPVHHSQPIW